MALIEDYGGIKELIRSIYVDVEKSAWSHDIMLSSRATLKQVRQRGRPWWGMVRYVEMVAKKAMEGYMLQDVYTDDLNWLELEGRQ